MSAPDPPPLRRGWTTGACATAATKAALSALAGGILPDTVTITLPRGETPEFSIAHKANGPDWFEAGIVKDAGDDPDVTHGALVIARVAVAPEGAGVVFAAGPGVGMVTRPGLPVAVGEPAINPAPRAMMTGEVEAAGFEDVHITISIPNGDAIAKKTWNPRLGITGGLSILGTTGIVRPFSCAAWIASIHRGVDVARAAGLDHVAGTTGATSEATVQALYDLPDHAMLDMGDFYGGMIKYLIRHPVPRVTIGGGIGKLTKLAQGAIDLHSARSQIDFSALGALAEQYGLDGDRARNANTALEALTALGPALAEAVAFTALEHVKTRVAGTGITPEIIVIDREGAVLARVE